VLSGLADGDCIDDTDALRAGGTARVLGFTVKAASTIGTFLRSFRWGHVRQLDAVRCELLARLGGRRRTGCRPAHDRSRLDRVRDLRPGQGGRAPLRVHGGARLSPLARGGGRHGRGAHGAPARGTREHHPGCRPLPARDDRCAPLARLDNSACGPTRGSTPTTWWRCAGR
jgi:hypothetical protein